ncbi:MAG: AAA family ATPase, partial [Gallionella sp.]
PANIETIYLANPSLSREEMLYAIADGLGLKIEGERVGIIMQNIQNKLEEKAREGKRIAVLVDESHAMPPDTLEELRLLYNLQVGNAKLLQIVLFGQPELNAKLDQPNMRQLKDRIVHHFHMQPLSRNILDSYLMFRMRAAGYHGPNVFSPGAIKLIADASNGLMRRVNILADKSLLAAFVEDTYYIKLQHVQAALRDSELSPPRRLPARNILLAGAAAALLLIGLATWWTLNKPQIQPGQTGNRLSIQEKSSIQDKQSNQAGQLTPAVPAGLASEAKPPVAHPDKAPAPAKAAQPPPAPPASGKPAISKTPLFEQRLAAGTQLLEQKSAVASIQLFYNEEIRPERTEGFLQRAEKIGALHDIYLLPAKIGGKDGMRVLYGAYPSVDAAHNAIKDLPVRYQQAFATSTYIF